MEKMRKRPSIGADGVDLRQVMKQFRLRSGKTQYDVADEMGTSQSAISDIEAGKTDPRFSTAQRYMRVVAPGVVFGIWPPVISLPGVVHPMEVSLTPSDFSRALGAIEPVERLRDTIRVHPMEIIYERTSK